MLEKLKGLLGKGSDDVEQRRRDVREEVVSGLATIEDRRYPVKNWSARGFCIGPTLITPQPGDRLDFAFSIPLPDPTLEFACRAAVLRYSERGREFGGVFLNPDEDTQSKIDEHFDIVDPKRRT